MEELKNIKKNQGFKVPDNYFDNFEKKMLEITKNQQPVTNKKTYTIKQSWLIAASFTLVILISAYLYNNTQQTNKQNIDNLAYLECTIDEIDYDLLIEESTKITKTEQSDEELLILQEEISDDEIIDILNSEQ
jgi:hypothetical protein